MDVIKCSCSNILKMFVLEKTQTKILIIETKNCGLGNGSFVEGLRNCGFSNKSFQVSANSFC